MPHSKKIRSSHLEKEYKDNDVAQSIKKYKNNVTCCHNRIHLTHSVLAHIVYKDTEQLFHLIEDSKAMELSGLIPSGMSQRP